MPADSPSSPPPPYHSTPLSSPLHFDIYTLELIDKTDPTPMIRHPDRLCYHLHSIQIDTDMLYNLYTERTIFNVPNRCMAADPNPRDPPNSNRFSGSEIQFQQESIRNYAMAAQNQAYRSARQARDPQPRDPPNSRRGIMKRRGRGAPQPRDPPNSRR
ncbi:hypothetical protein CERZMDRAFT_84291 [Cercospora zeae-maydis SCOH1-5]|uniref:Uncharacterized protein n=1 Tax=Cercospora zeae-maydis SCOH1-5 TaxID=717836 RepID=A0A6A6FGR5_9PEZI|nr:hypothetical protein CERZMDRAFT_84291 [Cercospora zeae-maydis SCOH1-5]